MKPRTLAVLLCLSLLLIGFPAGAQEWLWCHGCDQVLFDVHPQSHLLTIRHDAAMYNCCPLPVTYELAVGEGVIDVTEIVGEEAPCDCICCFNYKVEVGSISAGQWTVRFHWLNAEDGLWTTRETQVVVPDGQGQPQLANVELSDCLGTTPVIDPEPSPTRWDAIKSWYVTGR